MRKADWKKKIIKSCKSAGTYKPEFLPTISLLADIMEDYDNARNKYIANGKQSTVEIETDRGTPEQRKLRSWQSFRNTAETHFNTGESWG